MNNSKSVLTPRWCGELARYFTMEGSTPASIIYSLRHASSSTANADDCGKFRSPTNVQ